MKDSIGAPLPDKPSEKHTVLIICQKKGCGKKRWVKPQDVWQVKLCRWCKEEEIKAKSKVKLAALAARVVEKKEQIASIDWRALKVQAHEAGMNAVYDYRASAPLIAPPVVQTGPKARRVWP